MNDKKLVDIIDYNLTMLFVGYNPSLRSAEFGHHFAGRGNNFWRLLYQSGLTKELYTYEEDRELLAQGYGISNIVERPTKAADEISRAEYENGRDILRKKIEKYRPQVVCHVGIGVYRTYVGKSKADWGIQDSYPVQGVTDFVVPNPSGLNRMSFTDQLQHYAQLHQYVQQLNKNIKKKNRRILNCLRNTYPQATSTLNFNNPFELLVATMLSAQSTDKQVNIVTEKLFRELKKPADYVGLTPEQLAPKIQKIGLFKNKSKNIIATCKILLAKYNGQVPDTMEELSSLPGVGRKTANVVLANAFHKPAIAVDTHVFRVANRLGLANSNNVEGTEKDLMANIPMAEWSDAHHWLIYHGRNLCTARNPKCEQCSLSDYCDTNLK